jgi:hypothetical protein
VDGIGCRRFSPADPRASGDVLKAFDFLAMPPLPQVACQNFTGANGNKGEELAKNFASQRDGLALQFLQMKHPGLIREIGSCNLHFSRPAKATSNH